MTSAPIWLIRALTECGALERVPPDLWRRSEPFFRAEQQDAVHPIMNEIYLHVMEAPTDVPRAWLAIFRSRFSGSEISQNIAAVKRLVFDTTFDEIINDQEWIAELGEDSLALRYQAEQEAQYQVDLYLCEVYEYILERWRNEIEFAEQEHAKQLS